MNNTRLYHSKDHFQPNTGDPIRAVIVETKDATVVAWYLSPGQRIAPHVHPSGQDTWTILSGTGDYITDASGSTLTISTGDVLVARAGDVHAVINTGKNPLSFISVVSPLDAGFDPL